MVLRLPVFAFLFIVATACLAPAWAQAESSLPDHLVVTTKGGAHRFSVEWATTPAERERGLMFRKSMAADHGMIFDFGDEEPVAFWMKNTPLSLDMVFIAADGTVKRVKQRAKPYSTDVIPSGAPVRYVLELVGGTAARLGLAPGDMVTIPKVD